MNESKLCCPVVRPPQDFQNKNYLKLLPFLAGLFFFIAIFTGTGYSQWAVGLSGSWDLPLADLTNRIAPAAGFNGSLTIPLDRPKNLHIYSSYASFSTADKFRERLQPYFPDSLAHFYQTAHAEMTLFSFGFNMLRDLKPRGNFQPYWFYGADLANQKSKIFRTTAAGTVGMRLMTAEGTDSGLDLPPIEENRTTFGAGFGVGARYRILPHLALDLNCRYHFIISELVAAEIYGIERIFPLQFVHLSLGMNYVF